jgi:hypothetical protein
VDDKLIGKRVRCPACGAVLTVTAESSPTAAGRPRPRGDDEEEAPPPPRKRRPVAEEEAVQAAPRHQRVMDDDEEQLPPPRKRQLVQADEEEDRPSGKRKKQAAGAAMWVLLAGAAAALLLVLAGAGVGAYFLFIQKSTTPAAATATKTGENKETYDVKLWTPSKVGEMVEFTIVEDHSLKSVWQGVQGKDEDKSGKAKAQGTAKVLRIDAKGRSTQTEFTFSSFNANNGKGDKEVLPVNTVVVRDVEGAGPPKYVRKDGGVLSPEAIELLGDILGRGKKDAEDADIDDNTAFGTTGKKAVGDSWPPNKALVLKSISKGEWEEIFSDVKEENLSGKVKLANAVKEAGATFLDFEVEFSVTFPGQPKDLGKGLTASVTGRISVTLTARYPADYSTGRVRDTSRMDMTLNMAFKGPGGEAKATFIATGSSTKTFKYLSSGGKEPDAGKKPRADLRLPPVPAWPRVELALVQVAPWGDRRLGG